MSAVRIFDAPHIFRYGMIDEDKGETWQLFYRNAVCFTVDIKREDIVGTPFEQERSKHCIENIDPKNFVRRWEDFCDCVVAHILPTLKKLATIEGRAWTTLSDYLETPTYKLQLFKDEATGDAVPRVMEGPAILEAIYSMEPQAFAKFNIPADLPRVPSSDVIVLGHDKDWRNFPTKVRISSEGSTMSLMRAQRESTAAETNITTNRSISAMAGLLKMHYLEEDLNIPKPLAVVTAVSSVDSEMRVAGLLYSSIPETAELLADIEVSTLAAARSDGRTARWNGQLSEILRTLHAHGLVHASIGQFTIWIDFSPADGVAWLEPPLHDPPSRTGEGEKRLSRDTDWECLDSVFDVWVVQRVGEQVAKRRQAPAPHI